MWNSTDGPHWGRNLQGSTVYKHNVKKYITWATQNDQTAHSTPSRQLAINKE